MNFKNTHRIYFQILQSNLD